MCTDGVLYSVCVQMVYFILYVYRWCTSFCMCTDGVLYRNHAVKLQ